MKQAVEPNL